MTLELSEILITPQGEGPIAGLMTAFVRCAKCNCRCSYCDTEYSWTVPSTVTIKGNLRSCGVLDNPVKIERLYDHLEPFLEECAYIYYTGGEPLLQVNDLIALTKHTLTESKEIGIAADTNGLLPDAVGQILPYLNYLKIDCKDRGAIGSEKGIEKFVECVHTVKDSLRGDTQPMIVLNFVVTPDYELPVFKDVLRSIDDSASYPLRALPHLYILLQVVTPMKSVSERPRWDLIEALHKESLTVLPPSRILILPQIHRLLDVL